MCGNASHRLSMPRRHYTEVRAWRWNATSITSSAGTRGRLLVVGGVVLPGQQRCSCLRSDEHTGSSTRLWCFSGCRLTAVCTLGDLEPVPCLERVDLLQLVSELPLQRLGQLRLKTFRMSTACFFFNHRHGPLPPPPPLQKKPKRKTMPDMGKKTTTTEPTTPPTSKEGDGKTNTQEAVSQQTGVAHIATTRRTE